MVQFESRLFCPVDTSTTSVYKRGGEASMGCLRILTSDEEEEYGWDASSPAEVQAARERFDRCLKANVIAYKTMSGSGEAIHITRFDPAAEEIFILGL